jgi:hypothetical protein
MLRKGNANVCALYPLPDDVGDHPSWNVYVSVTDTAASDDAAIALGGEVIAPPTDIMRAGRMAVVQNPTGAFVSLWQPDEHTGADLQNEHGNRRRRPLRLPSGPAGRRLRCDPDRTPDLTGRPSEASTSHDRRSIKER